MKSTGSLLLLLLFISGLTLNDASTTTYCRNFRSCYNTTISDYNVYCLGDQSCEYTEITAEKTVECNAYFACAYSDSIKTVTAGSFFSVVYCNGDYGCYHVNDGIISSYQVSVSGYYGASYSNIEAIDDVFCYGEYSCSYATINAGDDVSCFSKYSCSYADITLKSGSPIYANLVGYRAGYYANIYVNQTAVIRCSCDTCCEHLNVYYYGDLSDIYVYPTDCHSYANRINPDGVYCPYFIYTTSETLNKLKEIREKEIEASDDYDKFN